MSDAILLTRPAEAAKRFALSLPRGLRVIVSPLARVARTGPIPPLDRDVIVTSATALGGLDAGAVPEGRIAWCVGDATADAARALGFDAISAQGDAEALVSLLAERLGAGARLMHLRGEESRGDIAGKLHALGFDVIEAVVYRMEPQALGDEARQALARGEVALVTAFSPRGAAMLAEAIAPPERPAALAISEAAARPLRDAGFPSVIVARSPDASAMRAAIVAHMK